MTTTAEENGNASAALAKIATDISGMDVRTLATVLVRSGYFQDTRDLSQATVKVLAGRELGFGPIASMQGVYIVKGRVSLASNLIAAAIQRSGRFRYRVTKLDATGCTILFFEKIEGRWEEVGVSTFDAKDAAAAGLAGGDNYKHFPRNMFFARALTNGARWYCPEVFNGPVYTPDELGARVDDDGVVIDIPAAPPVDTESTRQRSEQYTRIYGDDTTTAGSPYDLQDSHQRGVSPAAVEGDASEESLPSSEALVTSKTHPLWQDWLKTEAAARKAGIDQDTSSVKLGHVSESALKASIDDLQGQVAEATKQTAF